MNPTLDVKELEEEIYCVRILVFLESEPQSNKYRQFLLTGEQFKKMSLTLSGFFATGEMTPNGPAVMSRVSDRTYYLPDLKQVHE